jgi:hypothetical protein
VCRRRRCAKNVQAARDVWTEIAHGRGGPTHYGPSAADAYQRIATHQMIS